MKALLDNQSMSIYKKALFVTTQLNWKLVYNATESFYRGTCLTTAPKDADLKSVVGLINTTISQILKNNNLSPKRSSALSATNFALTDEGFVYTDVKGVRDVPQIFPTQEILKQLKISATQSTTTGIPTELAMNHYSQLLKASLELKGHVYIPASKVESVNIINASSSQVGITAKPSFVSKLIKERAERNTKIAVAA